MKTKTMGSLFLAVVGLFLMGSMASAASAVRGPKEMTTIFPTASVNISSVTPFNVWDSTNSVQKPGAVYQLILSTGAAGDYAVLFDTNTAMGETVGAFGAGNQIGPKYYFGSTTANTVITFDPPVYFFNGLMVGVSSKVNQLGVVWENGRGLSGQ